MRLSYWLSVYPCALWLWGSMSQCHGHCNASCHLSHTGHYTLHYNTASINHYSLRHSVTMSHCTQVTWSPGHGTLHCSTVTQCAPFANCDVRVVCSCQYVTSWWLDDGLMETSAPGNNIVMRRPGHESGLGPGLQWSPGSHTTDRDHDQLISSTGKSHLNI